MRLYAEKNVYSSEKKSLPENIIRDQKQLTETGYCQLSYTQNFHRLSDPFRSTLACRNGLAENDLAVTDLVGCTIYLERTIKRFILRILLEKKQYAKEVNANNAVNLFRIIQIVSVQIQELGINRFRNVVVSYVNKVIKISKAEKIA